MAIDPLRKELVKFLDLLLLLLELALVEGLQLADGLLPLVDLVPEHLVERELLLLHESPPLFHQHLVL